MGKCCVVWGTRAVGRQLAEQASGLGYHVIAYCSSRVSSQGKKIGNFPVISPNELKDFYLAGKIDSILLGVKNPEYRKEVEDLISGEMPSGISLIYSDTIENECLSHIWEQMHYRWNIKFEEQAKIWLENFQNEVDFWANQVANSSGPSHAVYKSRIENEDFLGRDQTCGKLAKTLQANSVVMDIGCGLLSKYGNRLPNSELIQLIAVDPLAPFYNRINQICAPDQFTASQAVKS